MKIFASIFVKYVSKSNCPHFSRGSEIWAMRFSVSIYKFYSITGQMTANMAFDIYIKIVWLRFLRTGRFIVWTNSKCEDYCYFFRSIPIMVTIIFDEFKVLARISSNICGILNWIISFQSYRLLQDFILIFFSLKLWLCAVAEVV